MIKNSIFRLANRREGYHIRIGKMWFVVTYLWAAMVIVIVGMGFLYLILPWLIETIVYAFIGYQLYKLAARGWREFHYWQECRESKKRRNKYEIYIATDVTIPFSS